MMLSTLFNSQKTYGKQPEQLNATVKLFQMVLADYAWPDIEAAFKVYVKRSGEMPTPHDIVDLIERKGLPPLERSVYVNLCKKAAEDLSLDDWQYIKDFEHYQKTGQHRQK